MSTIDIDFKSTYFQHSSLTQVYGEPTYQSLQKLYKEIKANATSVASVLGGGLHGYLGLVVSPVNYARTQPTHPFVRPAHPGALNIAATATQYNIALAKDVHDTATKTFKECNLLERTLIQQIKDAVHPDFLEALTDDDTGLITGTIVEIMAYLFDTFGYVNPTALNDKRDEILALTIDANKPIDTLFNTINKYAGVAEAAGSDETPAQLINIAMILLTKSGMFTNDIRRWYERPTVEKTWPRFKTHFRDAQKAIRNSTPTVDQLGFHNANLVEQIVTGLRDHSITDEESHQASGAAPNDADTLTTCANATVATSASTTPSNLAMATQMQEMQATILALQNQRPQSNSSGRSHGGRTGRGTGRGGPGRGARPTPQYCWSHGSCSHLGTACSNRTEGHKPEATFQNMLNGSTKRCYWLSP
jgi:hypothetical protein